jgi:phosphate butyryltransferase
MLARRRRAWEKPGGVEPVQTLAELVDRARAAGPRVVAVPAAESETALAAVVEARRRGVARGLLLGDAERLADRLWKLEEDPSHHEILHEPDDVRAAARAVDAVRAGAATLLLKGRLPTGDLLRAVLDRSRGLRTGRILSDVMVSEHPSAAPPRVVGITDGGVNVAPDLEAKRAILENAVRVFHRLGFERPVVAVLCAVETVSDAMPHTRDARELAEAARRGEIRGCEVVGPLALDNAILPWAARAKGIEHPLAGRADLLLVPTIEAGNILGKAFSWLAARPVAHVIEGARVPVLIPSRVERADDKLLSIALGVLSAEEVT